MAGPRSPGKGGPSSGTSGGSDLLLSAASAPAVYVPVGMQPGYPWASLYGQPSYAGAAPYSVPEAAAAVSMEPAGGMVAFQLPKNRADYKCHAVMDTPRQGLAWLFIEHPSKTVGTFS